MIKKNEKIFLAGHNGLVGSSILRILLKKNYSNIETIDKKKLNLIDQKNVLKFLKRIKPKVVIIAAAKVGGIYANNKFKAEFIYENLQIQNNLIHASYLCGVKKLIFLGSSCVYPKNCMQPIKEDYLLTSSLEKTNDSYALAKITGIKMCQSYNEQYKTNYISLMPCNTYGPNDNFDLKTSHFLPALIRKICDAKKFNKRKFIVWGSGNPLREIIYVDDLAEACIFFLNKKINHNLINIGSNDEMSIKSYAKIIKKIIGYKGKMIFNRSMPDGTFRKKLDTSIANRYGWYPKTSLYEGLKKTIQFYLKSNS